jgi:hypothetical protein
MAPVPTAKADGAKIRELIRERGTVAAFARKIGRHPQSFWDIANPNRDMNVSITFLRQIARELGVRLSDISDASDDQPETTNPRRWIADIGSGTETKVPAA